MASDTKQEYVLEQTVSVEVGQEAAALSAVVWLDNGRDLSQSVQGPWCPFPGTRPWETYFFPVIVHQPTLVLNQVAAPPSAPCLWQGQAKATALPMEADDPNY